MYITLVTDILVHYYMGKIQEVIFLKFAIEKEKRKFLFMFVYISVQVCDIYTHYLYIYTYAMYLVRLVISILYLFKLSSILKIYIKIFKFLLCWNIIHGYSLSCLRNN